MLRITPRRWRRYALAGGTLFCSVALLLWFLLQLHVTNEQQLTPATEAFFAGFALVMGIPILMNYVGTVSNENTTIVQSTEIQAELQHLRTEVQALREALKQSEGNLR